MLSARQAAEYVNHEINAHFPQGAYTKSDIFPKLSEEEKRSKKVEFEKLNSADEKKDLSAGLELLQNPKAASALHLACFGYAIVKKYYPAMPVEIIEMAVKYKEESEFIAPCLLLNPGTDEIICDPWNNTFGSLDELAQKTYSFYSYIPVVDKTNSSLVSQGLFPNFRTWAPITGTYEKDFKKIYPMEQRALEVSGSQSRDFYDSISIESGFSWYKKTESSEIEFKRPSYRTSVESILERFNARLKSIEFYTKLYEQYLQQKSLAPNGTSPRR